MRNYKLFTRLYLAIQMITFIVICCQSEWKTCPNKEHIENFSVGLLHESTSNYSFITKNYETVSSIKTIGTCTLVR